VHGGQDRALVGALPGVRDRRIERGIGQFCGAAHIGELGCGLHQAQAGDQVRGVDCRCEAVERRIQPPAVGRRETVGLVLDAEPFAREALLGQEIAQLQSRIAALAVDPDADVLDDRGVLRLAQVRRAREQHQIAVGAQHQALGEAVAERVVAGQPVHALLLEHQQGIELAPRDSS
jgi:hypothetical protein